MTLALTYSLWAILLGLETALLRGYVVVNRGTPAPDPAFRRLVWVVSGLVVYLLVGVGCLWQAAQVAQGCR